ncbi:MAG: GxxExxY protein [Caldilineaceae bacterium]|nr:GxxExxY protein [Caldilineaceae bacterium]
MALIFWVVHTVYKHSDITEQIIGAFYTVYNELGHGFLEKVYENTLAYENQKRHLVVKQQQHIKVYYDVIIVGEYFADLLVADKVIVEIKAAENIDEAHLARLTNYLKATRFEVGLVLNLGPQPQVKRHIFDQQISTKSV